MAKKSRNMLERVLAIFDYIEAVTDIYGGESITKSHFQKIGISPKNIDQWLELIVTIQNMPRIKVIREGRVTRVDTLENKFMIYLRQKFLNENLTYEERNTAMIMYLKVLINIEKTKGDDIDWETLINDPWKISRPTIIRLVEEAMAETANKS